MKVKWFLGALIGAVGIFSSAVLAQAQEQTDLERIFTSKKVRIGATEGPPWYHQDLATGKWTGVAPEIAELIFSTIGVEIEYVPTEWSTAAAGLQSDKFDVMGAFNATPLRALAADFTIPFYEEPNGLLILGEETPQMKKWADLNVPEFSFSATQGTSIQQAVENLIPEAKGIWVVSYGNSVMDLESGRVNAIVGSQAAALDFIRARGKGHFIIPEPQVGVYVNFGVRKSREKDLRDWMNISLSFHEQSGAIEKIRRKYFP